MYRGLNCRRPAPFCLVCTILFGKICYFIHKETVGLIKGFKEFAVKSNAVELIF
jgi:hypothetical protein